MSYNKYNWHNGYPWSMDKYFSSNLDFGKEKSEKSKERGVYLSIVVGGDIDQCHSLIDEREERRLSGNKRCAVIGSCRSINLAEGCISRQDKIHVFDCFNFTL